MSFTAEAGTKILSSVSQFISFKIKGVPPSLESFSLKKFSSEGLFSAFFGTSPETVTSFPSQKAVSLISSFSRALREKEISLLPISLR